MALLIRVTDETGKTFEHDASEQDVEVAIRAAKVLYATWQKIEITLTYEGKKHK